jgi:uncharacterized membrane protein
LARTPGCDEAYNTVMATQNAVLVGIELLAASVWIGSLVCLVVVANAARSSLEPSTQVAFFRALGRRYGTVGNLALATAIGVGLALLWPPSAWGRLEDAAVALSGLLVLITGLGIAQARSMTRLRRRLLDEPRNHEVEVRVRRGAKNALALRGAIAGVSLAILSVVAVIISY